MTRRSPMNDRYTTEREGGATRRGSGSMKPASRPASSVRTSSGKKSYGGGSRGRAMQMMNADSNKTKEEKKLERTKRRQEEDELYTASSILVNKDDKYHMWRRVWWACLIGAVVFTALSWASLSTGVGGQVVSVVVLILAYATIIAALVIDVGPVRKRRNVYRDKVDAMSKKQVERILSDSYVDRQATDAAKKARKEAKKAGQDPDAAYKAAYDSFVEGAHAKHSGEDDSASKGATKSNKGATATGDKGSSAGSVATSEGQTAAESSSDGKKRGHGILFGKRKAEKASGTPVDETATGETGSASSEVAASDKPATEADAAEAARKEAAAKAARDFAASRRSGTGK